MPVALWLAALLGAITVEGPGTCPPAADVEARLREWGVAAPPGQNHRLTLTLSAATVVVTLRDETGAILGERALPAETPCRELTQAAAALAAAWEASVSAPVLPHAPPADAELARPAPAAAGPPVPDVASEAQPRRKKKRRWVWEIAAAIDTAAHLHGVAVGPLGFASLTPDNQGLGADVWFGALGPHDVALSTLGVTDPVYADQDLTWQRFPLGVGAHWRLLGDPVRIDLHAEGLVALLSVSVPGGFALPGHVSSVDEGVGAGVRVEAALGPIFVWFGLSGAVWPATKTVSVGTAPGQELPHAEVLVQQGIALSGG